MALHALAAAFSLAVLLPFGALANDGFYQGAGYHLVPVKSTALRVVRERLRISALQPARCFPVLYQGKPDPGPAGFKVQPDHRGFSLGASGACGSVWDSLVASWSADVVYEVEAISEAKDVQIGFPVPPWIHQFSVEAVGLDETRLPAAAEFQTFIDGERVDRTALKELELPGVPRGSHRDRTEPAHFPGWSWLASFSKGTGHILRTTYVFGEEGENSFYPGAAFPKELPPWFINEDGSRAVGGSQHLRYFLTPMRTWADPAPDAVDVRIDLPKGIPSTYFVPVAARPSCVDSDAIYFHLEGQFPADDIHLAYPNSGALDGRPLAPLHTSRQWAGWLASLGPGAKVACRLRDDLLKTADASLRKVLGDYRCQESCEVAPTWPVDFPGAYPETSRRRLDAAELAGKTAQELRLMRNEIFARHGYRFRDPELLAHFEKVPGYRPRFVAVEPLLSDAERENVTRLLAAEAGIKRTTSAGAPVKGLGRTP
jgi:hypothetical protein